MKAGSWIGAATVVGAAGWLGWDHVDLQAILAAVPGLAQVDAGSLDLPSATFGVAAGLSLGALHRVSWLELPRRALRYLFELPRRLTRWLLVNERNIYRAGAAAVCLGILIFY